LTLNLKKENIQIYILSRNRPVFLRLAIDSLLKQNHSLIKFEIIISDNSDNDDVREMIERDYAHKDIKYIRRNAVASHMGHTQLVVSELNSEYAVIFHDDDILHPDYVNVMSSFLSNNDILAVGCNCMIFRDNVKDPKNVQDSRLGIRNLSSPIKFNNEKQFLERYLPGNGGIVFLPSYMYRTKYLQKIMLKFPFRIGKPGEPSSADALMLSSLLNYGEIVWLEKSLMYYRVHASNLSVIESIPERLALLNYMKKKGIKKNSTNLLLYRIMFWVNWVLQQGSILTIITHRRYRVIILSILLKIIKISVRWDFWRIVFLRYKNRWNI
jgi:glycosyltransferase involved in cell wall biosynthesis